MPSGREVLETPEQSRPDVVEHGLLEEPRRRDDPAREGARELDARRPADVPSESTDRGRAHRGRGDLRRLVEERALVDDVARTEEAEHDLATFGGDRRQPHEAVLDDAGPGDPVALPRDRRAVRVPAGGVGRGRMVRPHVGAP
jgi:hypothetical protein